MCVFSYSPDPKMWYEYEMFKGKLYKTLNKKSDNYNGDTITSTRTDFYNYDLNDTLSYMMTVQNYSDTSYCKLYWFNDSVIFFYLEDIDDSLNYNDIQIVSYNSINKKLESITTSEKIDTNIFIPKDLTTFDYDQNGYLTKECKIILNSDSVIIYESIYSQNDTGYSYIYKLYSGDSVQFEDKYIYHSRNLFQGYIKNGSDWTLNYEKFSYYTGDLLDSTISKHYSDTDTSWHRNVFAYLFEGDSLIRTNTYLNNVRSTSYIKTDVFQKLSDVPITSLKQLEYLKPSNSHLKVFDLRGRVVNSSSGLDIQKLNRNSATGLRIIRSNNQSVKELRIK